MTVNELWTPVSSNELSTLLSRSLLDDLIRDFEKLFSIDVCIFDSQGNLFYGRETHQAPVFEAAILINHQEIGRVGIGDFGGTEQGAEAAMYLARSLSIVATEIARRRQISDEVLERYDELNVIYDLASLISSNTLTQTELVEHVLSEASRILHAEAGVIYTYDDKEQELLPVHYFGDDTDPQFWSGRIRELARSALHAYDDTQLFEDDRVICAPLRYDEERLGALVLIRHDGEQEFKANDVHLMATLSHNTTLFLQAARLIDTLARQKQALEETLTELQAARDLLSRSERLSIIGQTIGGLVHDMRKPLSNVMGYAGLLQEDDLTDEERYEYASQIIGFINTFSSMAQEILDYTHGDDEHVERTVTKVGDYMRFVEGRLKPPGLDLAADLEMDVSAAADLTVMIDRQRFFRVFQNLVNNAIDAIEDHGGSQVVVKAEPAGEGMIQFTIADDGPGVPPDKVESIFEPLITTKAHGTGLGLAIVQRMINIHGGKIRYETSSQGGAAFVFTVPQA